MAGGVQVLLWMPDAEAAPFGGHVVQMDATIAAVERIGGIRVRTSCGDRPDWRGIDVVHGLGLAPRHVREARLRGIPVCLSVIYWSKALRESAGARASRKAFIRRARLAVALSLAAAQGRHMDKSEDFARLTIQATALYEAVDMLLPNSQLEADAIARDLGVTTPMRVVPNAADPSRFSGGLPWGERRGVVYVARLEPHKNQLGLIRALKGTGLALTLVGGEHPDHPNYARAVRAQAGASVTVLGHTSQYELVEIYRRARVHAIPSAFETTGLVSLEAALCGCNVVTTERGYTREYFEDMAWYCKPDDVREIRSAVLAAYASPPEERLRRRILDRYTWDHTGAATVAAYRDLLNHQV